MAMRRIFEGGVVWVTLLCIIPIKAHIHFETEQYMMENTYWMSDRVLGDEISDRSYGGLDFSQICHNVGGNLLAFLKDWVVNHEAPHLTSITLGDLKKSNFFSSSSHFESVWTRLLWGGGPITISQQKVGEIRSAKRPAAKPRGSKPRTAKRENEHREKETRENFISPNLISAARRKDWGDSEQTFQLREEIPVFKKSNTGSTSAVELEGRMLGQGLISTRIPKFASEDPLETDRKTSAYLVEESTNEHIRERKGYWKTFTGAVISSGSITAVSELGDRTFLIAALMCLKHSRLLVYISSVSALFVMTGISTSFGGALRWLPQHWRAYESYALEDWVSGSILIGFALLQFYQLLCGNYTVLQFHDTDNVRDVRHQGVAPIAETKGGTGLGTRLLEGEINSDCFSEGGNSDIIFLVKREDYEVPQQKSLQSDPFHNANLKKETPKSQNKNTPKKSTSSQHSCTEHYDTNHTLDTSQTAGLISLSTTAPSPPNFPSPNLHPDGYIPIQPIRPKGTVRFARKPVVVGNARRSFPLRMGEPLRRYGESVPKKGGGGKGEVGDSEIEQLRHEIEAIEEEKLGEKPSVMAVMSEIFIITFLAEIGDKSMFATIALAAAENPAGVFVGGCIGHAMVTLLAIGCGSILNFFVNEFWLLVINGITLFFFGLTTLIHASLETGILHL